jgi:ABC-type polysaccharide/polyol phosphate export permease
MYHIWQMFCGLCAAFSSYFYAFMLIWFFGIHFTGAPSDWDWQAYVLILLATAMFVEVLRMLKTNNDN